MLKVALTVKLKLWNPKSFNSLLLLVSLGVILKLEILVAFAVIVGVIVPAPNAYNVLGVMTKSAWFSREIFPSSKVS